MTEVKTSFDARQFTMRTRRLVGMKSATMEGSSRGEPVGTGSSGAHSHGSRETESNHSHRARTHGIIGGEEIHVGGGVALHRVWSQRRRQFPQPLGCTLVPKLQRKVENWNLTGAVEQVWNQDGIPLLRQTPCHAEVRRANPSNVDEIQNSRVALAGAGNKKSGFRRSIGHGCANGLFDQ